MVKPFPEKSDILRGLKKHKVEVPLEKLASVDARRRHWLRTAVKKLETLQKYSIFQLRGFEYKIKMGWNGINPYLYVEIVLENVDERESVSDVGFPNQDSGGNV